MQVGGTGRGSTWPAGSETSLGAPVPPCGKLCLMSLGVGGGGAGWRAHTLHYRTWEGHLGSGCAVCAVTVGFLKGKVQCP